MAAADWLCRGKSGLQKATVPGNARAGQPDGKRHRKHTAPQVGVRSNRWGKSPPRLWQQRRHGKPHREQRQIGIPPLGALFAQGSGLAAKARVVTPRSEEWSSPFGEQNPAYRPSAHIYVVDRTGRPGKSGHLEFTQAAIRAAPFEECQDGETNHD